MPLEGRSVLAKRRPGYLDQPFMAAPGTVSSLAEQRAQWDPQYVSDFQDALLFAFMAGITATAVLRLVAARDRFDIAGASPATLQPPRGRPTGYGASLDRLWSYTDGRATDSAGRLTPSGPDELADDFVRPLPEDRLVRTMQNQAYLSTAGAGQGLAATFRIAGSFQVSSIPVMDWAKAHVLGLVTDLGEQQRQNIRTIIFDTLSGQVDRNLTAPLIEQTLFLHPRQAQWVSDRAARLLASGLTPAEVGVQTRAFSEELLRARALVIARTEVMAAENMGQMEAWRQAKDKGLIPDGAQKVWVMGPGACVHCATVAGTTVDLEASFMVNGVAKLVPPAHPNCRCTVGLIYDKGRIQHLTGLTEPFKLKKHRLAKSSAVPHHDGVMIALRPPGHIAAALREAGQGNGKVLDLDEFHITLAFLGKVGEVDEAALHRAVEAWSVRQHPLWFQVSGTDEWDNREVNGDHVIVAEMQTARETYQARELLAEMLKLEGAPASEKWEWKPHMTITYDPAGPVLLPAGVREGWTADTVWVVEGDLWTSYPVGLAKHQRGSHDQKTHGRRGNAGGESERIAAATARIKTALPNADLSGLASQMSMARKEDLAAMEERSASYAAYLKAGFPKMEWDAAAHGVKLKPTASEMEAIADAAEKLRKEAPLAADDCRRLEFQSLIDDSGLSKNLAQADWAQGGWKITFDLERTRFALGESYGTSVNQFSGERRKQTSSLFRQADSPQAAQRVIALHEFAHGVAMSGESAHQVMGRPGDGLTQKLLFSPSPAGLSAASSNAAPPRPGNYESIPVFSRSMLPAAVSDYALSNPGEFFAENVASLWSGVNRPHADTRHWLSEYLLWRSRQVTKAQEAVNEAGTIEDDFGEEPWRGWSEIRKHYDPTAEVVSLEEIAKHSGGTGHDQKSHGNWARGGTGGIPFDAKGELRALSIPDRKAAWEALSEKERDLQADPLKTIDARITEVTKPLGDWKDSGDLKADVAARVKKAGDLIPADSQKLISDHMQQLADELAASGVDAKLARKITTEATDALIAQDYESLGRTLGDHGARHLMQDADYTMSMLRELSKEHPALDDPRVRAAALLTAVYHDAGYMTPPSRAFLDEGHPRWSQDYFDARIAGDIDAALGRGTRDLMSLTIASHDTIKMDWTKRPFSSAFRLSDNLGLFHAEKLPPFMHAVPKNVGVIARLGQTLATAKGPQVGEAIRRAQSEARANIQAQPGLTSQQRLRMMDAVEEISPILPKLSLGMVGARLTGFSWDRDNRTMEATVQRSQSADDISRVVDVGQRQFVKLAETYHVDPASVRQENRIDFDYDQDGSPDFSLVITGNLLKHQMGQHDQKSHGRRGGGSTGRNALEGHSLPTTYGMESLTPQQQAEITEAMAKMGITQESMDAQIRKVTELSLASEGIPAAFDGAVEQGRDWYGKEADRIVEVFRQEGLDLPRETCFAVVAALSQQLPYDRGRPGEPGYVDINAALAARTARLWRDRDSIDVPITQEAAALILKDTGIAVKPGNHKLGDLGVEVAGYVMGSHLGAVSGTGVVQRSGWKTTVQALSDPNQKALRILDVTMDPTTSTADRLRVIDTNLAGPKIRSFYNSFLTRGDWQGAVIDAWMIRAMVPEGAVWPSASNKGIRAAVRAGAPRPGPIPNPGHGWTDGTIRYNPDTHRWSGLDHLKPAAEPLGGSPSHAPGAAPPGWVHNVGKNPMFQEAILREARARGMRVSDLQAIVWYFIRHGGKGRNF